jgi:hypothetical protein
MVRLIKFSILIIPLIGLPFFSNLAHGLVISEYKIRGQVRSFDEKRIVFKYAGELVILPRSAIQKREVLNSTEPVQIELDRKTFDSLFRKK